MQKSCLKCRPFALFKNFCVFFLSKMKKDLFLRFLIFQTCNMHGNYNHFYQDASKELSGKSLRNNIVPAIFYIKL